MSKLTRTLTVAATILSFLLAMAAYTIPSADDAAGEIDGVVEPDSVTTTAAVPVVDSVTEAAVPVVEDTVETVEKVAEAVPAPLPAPDVELAPSPEPPPPAEEEDTTSPPAALAPAPVAEPAPAPSASSPSPPAPSASAPAPAPRPESNAGPAQPAPAGGAQGGGASTGSTEAPADRRLAAAGETIEPRPAAVGLSPANRAALQSSVGSSSARSGDGGSNSPVLQPLVAPPEGHPGLASALAPLVAPPAAAGMSDPRFPLAGWTDPINLPVRGDMPAWLLSAALGLLVLTAAAHAARIAAARRRSQA